MKRQKIAPGTPVECRMKTEERDLILDETFLEPEYLERLEPIEGKPGQLVGKFTLDDLEYILGHVAASANHAEDRKLARKLDAIFDRLSKLQRSYDDGGFGDSESS